MKKLRKKKKNIIKVVSFIITLTIIGLSIGFSAFQNELLVHDISGIVRIKKDIRITVTFGSSVNESGNPQRYFKGILKNMTVIRYE